MVLDGIYVAAGEGEVAFRPVAPPGDEEVARIAANVCRRVGRLLERRGLGPQADPEEIDTLRQHEPLLAELYGASVSGRIACGPRAGRGIVKAGAAVELEDLAVPSGPRCASICGFSLHANVCIPSDDRMRLERLLRYAGRPPVATERLSLLPDGRLLYRLKRRWRDGASHVIFEPLELVERLAVLVPPPRFNLVRYSGIFAPSAACRSLIIPDSYVSPFSVSGSSAHRDCPAREQPSADTAITGRRRPCRPRNYSWSQLMRRVFEIDVLECPRCGGRMRILCAIHPPDAIRKILDCLGLPSRPPPIASATPANPSSL